MKFIYSILVAISVSIFTYLIYIVAISFDNIQNFNGICPAGPTDIPAYPCTFYEFLIRIFFSPWAIMASIIIFPFWFLGHLILMYILFRIFGKSKK